jgi:septal ring factor EnvC (AmiA/AmiB activator)
MAVVVLAAVAAAQTPPPEGRSPAMRRLDDRVRALREEAERLATGARTLIGELRSLEIERDLRVTEATQASAALEATEQAIEESTERLAGLEQERDRQVPALRGQLVDLYKRGNTGYAEMLFGADDLREAGRAVRAVGALVELNHRRLEEHRLTLDALGAERAALEEQVGALGERATGAQAARAAAERAVKTHAARIAEIDSRRDLTAQYVGELQEARETLLRQLATPTGSQSTPATVPLRPFRGVLAWPVDGTVAGRFGQTANRLGGTAVRSGIDIAAAEDAAVHAIHEGTVAYAGPFTGFGTLVIVDHGEAHFSLYGYLSAVSVAVGTPVNSGAELGRVGNAPAGPSALYFELRIDGRAVDPVQWLEPR